MAAPCPCLQFSEFLKSQSGQNLTSQLNYEMDAGSLMIPVTIIEELCKLCA